MPTTSPPAAPDAALRSVHTANLPVLFERLHLSLLVSHIRRARSLWYADGSVLNTHFRPFANPGHRGRPRPLEHRRDQHRVGVPPPPGGGRPIRPMAACCWTWTPTTSCCEASPWRTRPAGTRASSRFWNPGQGIWRGRTWSGGAGKQWRRCRVSPGA